MRISLEAHFHSICSMLWSLCSDRPTPNPASSFVDPNICQAAEPQPMVGSCCLVSICRRGGMERGHVLLLHRNLTSSKLWAEALLLGTCGGCLQKLIPGQEPYPQERHSLLGLLQKRLLSQCQQCRSCLDSSWWTASLEETNLYNAKFKIYTIVWISIWIPRNNYISRGSSWKLFCNFSFHCSGNSCCMNKYIYIYT